MQSKIVSYLLGFYVFFAFYNTLIPFTFDYGFADLAEQIAEITLRPDRRDLAITDIVGNIILFMPFGFLMYMFLRYRNIGYPVIVATIAGLFLSLSIEFLQLFIKSRNTALHDLFNNSLGSLIGATVAAIYSYKVASVGRRIFYDWLERKPFLLLLSILGLSQAVAAMMPFTVSITVSHFKRSIKSTNIVPFAYESIGALFMNDPNNHDNKPFDWTSLIEDILFWMVIGYLLMICYRIYWKKKSYGILLLIGLPLLLFPMLEFMQLIIVSRITDINDIISGYLGTALGIAAYYLLRPVRRKQFSEHIDLLIIPAFMYFVFILFAGMRPFDWTMDPAVITYDLTAERMIPFYAYFKSTGLSNIYDLTSSLCYFLPISLFLSYRMRQAGRNFPPIYVMMTVAGLAVGLFIEGTQLLSPTRISEITDVLAYGMGGAMGTFAIYYLEKEVIPTMAAYRQ